MRINNRPKKGCITQPFLVAKNRLSDELAVWIIQLQRFNCVIF